MSINRRTAFACLAFALSLPLDGCMLATNGLDYKLQAPPPAPPPPPAPAPMAPPPPPPCSLNALGGCKTGDKVVLTGVNFALNKSELTLNAKSLLDPVAESLKATKTKIEIGGYTDNIGSSAYNLKLSSKRAKSVMAYLEAKGVDPAQLSASGYGEAMPVADNSTEDGREMNRRVEMKVM